MVTLILLLKDDFQMHSAYCGLIDIWRVNFKEYITSHSFKDI